MTPTRSPRRGKLALVAATALVAFVGLPRLAEASPLTITGTNVWRADRMPNPIGFDETALVPWVSVATAPGGDVTQTHVTATIEGTTYDLTRIPTGILAGLYYTQIPYDSSLAGNWTITATNGTDVVTSIRPGFVPVEAMPFVSSIYFTGTGTDITVHWDVTAEALPRLDEQQVTIWDMSGAAPTTVQFFPIGSVAREVNLSGLSLVEGVPYAVEINNVDRNALTGFIDAFSGNWLTGWTPTRGDVQLPPTAVPEPASILLVGAGIVGLLGRTVRRRVTPQ
jgi:hypothetical protein